MQRSFLVPAILALLAAALYWQREPALNLWRQAVAKSGLTNVTSPSSEHLPSSSPFPGEGTVPQATPRPNAAPGRFYMLVRAKVVSRDGVKAVIPGEEVRLVNRLPNGQLKVTVAGADFVVRNADVTESGAAAEEAERRFKGGRSSGM